jgi:lipid-binding SYLF domain-containing protein
MTLFKNRNKAFVYCLIVSGLIISAPSLGITHKEGPTPDEEREEILTMRKETLVQLYEEQAAAKSQVQNSVGYAVFSNFGMNLFLVSTGRGGGVVRDNNSGKDTYMKMFSAGGGFGMGVKTFRAIFIFDTREALNGFVESGWDFSGQADAAATTDADNQENAGAADEALTLTQGVTVYQLTDKGLALQATLQGTKYWKDEDLN